MTHRIVFFHIYPHWSFVGIVVIQVVRSKLEVPFQLSGVGIERQNAICVQVVAWARLAHEIGRRVARRPIQNVNFRIVCARYPGCATTMKIGIAGPTGRTKFFRPGNGPELPLESYCHCIVGGEESAHSRVSAGSAHDYGPFHNEWSAGRAVVFVLVGVFHVPSQTSRASIQTEQVCVIGFYINEMLPYGYAAVLMSRGIVELP